MAEQQIKDGRGWSPVDFGYLDNPKMLDVLDESTTAALAHLASVLYCAQHLTDGHIAPGIARRKVGASKDDDALLIRAGLWHKEGHDCPDCPQPEPGKVYVHDFLQHNRTAEGAKRRSAAGKAGAAARWGKVQEADDAPDDAIRSANRMRTALPIAMRSDENRNAEREKERKIDSSPPSKPAPKRATKLPDDWTPTPEHVEQARTAGIDADLEATKMRDWALSKGETRKDWDATFRNWIRNARPTPGYGSPTLNLDPRTEWKF